MVRLKHSPAVSVVVVTVATTLLAKAALADDPTTDWIRQLGTNQIDVGESVSVDGAGNVYVTGGTRGSLGALNEGAFDTYLLKYSGTGALRWIEQIGTGENEVAYGVTADEVGNVFIAGFTSGSLDGSNAGGDDAFLCKYDTTGDRHWTRQLGTSEGDIAEGVSADRFGNVFIAGYTGGSLDGFNAGGDDAFLRKYDTAGDLYWTKQFGTSESDRAEALSADGLGHVYVAGGTEGSLGGPNAGAYDAFVSKYNDAGDLLWARQLGTSEPDVASGVAADGLGHVYVTGRTYGSLGGPNAGWSDVFIAKYNAAGDLLWTAQLGTSESEGMDPRTKVSADRLGNVYISGQTAGSLGAPNSGLWDGFFGKYSDTGDLLWIEQIGTSEDDGAMGVFSDGLGGVHITGHTMGTLGTLSRGSRDLFVVKYFDRPELEADFDLDGDVDGDDFLAWQAGFGTQSGAMKSDGDYDNDGDVDGDDFLGWQSEFGSVNGAASAAVPESASVTMLLVLAAVATLSRRVRTRF